jgi:molybdate transport system regulatory protein
MAKQKGQTEIFLRLRVMHGGSIIFGPGRAGRQMGMSYKRAWALVDSLNTIFASPLVEAAKGGAGGGGAKLTPLGVALLSAYRRLEQECAGVSAAPLAQMQAALAVSPEPKSG